LRLDVLSVVHRYHYKFVGLESVRVDRATLMSLSLTKHIFQCRLDKLNNICINAK